MSVNGRPFKPDPTSYQMTGIPCGNPARYRSRGVIRMVPNKSIPFENQQTGIPGQGTVSAADMECQNMLKNQLNASADYARKTLNFQSSGRAGEVMFGSASGFLTLTQFQRLSEGDKESNQMRGLGFTDYQINHLLTQRGLMDEDLNKLRKRKAGNIVPHPDFVTRGIQEMMEAKEQKDAALDAEFNYEPAKKMSRLRAQLESALLQNKKHPLADIYHQKAKGGEEKVATVNIASFISAASQPYSDDRDSDGSSSDGSSSDGSSSDETSSNKLHSNLPVNFSSTKKTNKRKQHVTVASVNPESPSPPLAHTPPVEASVSPSVSDNPPSPPKPVVLKQKIEPLSEEVVLSNKVSEAVIREQFPQYEPGTPSKVLFLKNLDKEVSVEDLVSLFLRFQENGKEKLSYRILTGRMKGQAFVTFHDENTATKALDFGHRFCLKGKPLIIQYSKVK